MATKSSVVSGMGVAMSLVQTLVASVKKAGGSDKDIHRLTTPEANGVWDKIANLVIEAGKKVKEEFKVLLVDYGRSVKNRVESGKYDYVNPDITEEHFPVSKDEVGKKELQFTLYHFGKNVESDYAISEMEKDGNRPATLRELLAFGEANSELQRQFPIIELGSVWLFRHGRRHVAYLGGHSGKRFLNLFWYDNSWSDNCRFLGVGK